MKPHNKYNARRVTIDGITFDSAKEGRRWCDLVIMEKAGLISNLRRQVPIALQGQTGPILTPKGRQMRLTFDFVYDQNGCTVYEDVKGMRTRDYIVRAAVARAMGLNVRET